jgi:hypothetical protein
MTADDAAGRRANKSVMTGDVPGGAADRRALNAAFCLSGTAGQRDGKPQSGAPWKILHRSNP